MEPKESLEGGAEGILEEYINDRKNNGYVFFREGSKKSKVIKYLNDNNVDEDVLGYDAGGGGTDDELEEEIEQEQEGDEKKKSSSSSKTKKTDKAAAEKEKEKAEKKKEKERKRKKRESEAAASSSSARNGDDDDAMEEDDDDRRASSSYNKKHKRNSKSPIPIPPSVLRGRDERDKAKKEKADKDKENTAASAAESPSKKPSSKRSNGDDDDALSKKKEKRPSQAAAVTNDSEDDNEAIETSLKRSPLKEKKADQRKSEEPPHSSNNDTASKNIDEPVKAPHVATIPISRAEEEADEELLPLGSDVNAKIASWEDLLTVESLEQQNGPDDKEYKWLIRWNDEVQANGKRISPEEWIGNKLARRKFPQGLLSFYEDHLKFKSTPEDDEDQIEGPQGVNGDAVGGGTAMQQD